MGNYLYYYQKSGENTILNNTHQLSVIFINIAITYIKAKPRTNSVINQWYSKVNTRPLFIDDHKPLMMID